MFQSKNKQCEPARLSALLGSCFPPANSGTTPFASLSRRPLQRTLWKMEQVAVAHSSHQSTICSLCSTCQLGSGGVPAQPSGTSKQGTLWVRTLRFTPCLGRQVTTPCHQLANPAGKSDLNMVSATYLTHHCIPFFVRFSCWDPQAETHSELWSFSPEVMETIVSCAGGGWDEGSTPSPHSPTTPTRPFLTSSISHQVIKIQKG